MRLDIKTEGLREIQKNLKKVDDKVQRKIARRAVSLAATPILKKARQLAPSGSGALKKSIAKRTKHRAMEGYYSAIIGVRGGVFKDKKTAKRGGKGNEYHPNETIRYFRFLELGTKYHAAKPFLRPAIEGVQQEAIDKTKTELLKGIENAV